MDFFNTEEKASFSAAFVLVKLSPPAPPFPTTPKVNGKQELFLSSGVRHLKWAEYL